MEKKTYKGIYKMIQRAELHRTGYFQSEAHYVGRNDPDIYKFQKKRESNQALQNDKFDSKFVKFFIVVKSKHNPKS